MGTVTPISDDITPGRVSTYLSGREDVLEEWAKWLHATDYPIDWCTPNDPPPDPVLLKLAELWAEENRIPLDEALATIREEACAD